MQCLAKAEPVDWHFLPGYILTVSTREDGPANWPKGHYGIVAGNDPVFVFPPIPVPETAEFEKLWNEFRYQFLLDPRTSYRLVSAAIEAGYDLDEDGCFCNWIMERIYDRTRPQV